MTMSRKGAKTPRSSSFLRVFASLAELTQVVGLQIRSIDIEEPNLEAVFLHLAGRVLRDY